jgi:hypothetical protein
MRTRRIADYREVEFRFASIRDFAVCAMCHSGANLTEQRCLKTPAIPRCAANFHYCLRVVHSFQMFASELQVFSGRDRVVSGESVKQPTSDKFKSEAAHQR